MKNGKTKMRPELDGHHFFRGLLRSAVLMLALKMAISSQHSFINQACSGLFRSISPASAYTRMLFFDSLSSFNAMPIL